jgi:hypothetical protein
MLKEDVKMTLGTQRRDHHRAVLDAEVRLLVDVLAPFGVLSREELARRADCRFWREGTFEAALQAGVQRGVIALLPDGFVAGRHPRLSLRRRPANIPVRGDERAVSDR